MKYHPICAEDALATAIDYITVETFKRNVSPLKAVKQFYKAMKFIERAQKAKIKKKGRKHTH